MALTQKEFATIQALFNKMDTPGDFTAVRIMFNERNKTRDNDAQTKAKDMFSVGDKVKFTSSKKGVITGVISKINIKNIRVAVSKNQTWNVSPSLLEKRA